MVRWDIWPRDIVLQHNATASEWEDLHSLLLANCISARCPDGQPDVDDDLANRLEAYAAKRGNSSGAVLRWALIIGSQGRLELALQGLPASIGVVKGKPSLLSDQTPTIQLANIPVWYQAFNGGVAAGPVPTLTAEDPEESRELIKRNLNGFHAQLQLLAGKFISPEQLTLKDAQTVVKKPREGRGIPFFKRSAPSEEAGPSQQKRPRQAAESGRYLVCLIGRASRH